MTDEQLTVTIVASDPEVMLKIRRWLSWMHYNTAWGHSGTVAMDLDGDGSDRVRVEGMDHEPQRAFVERVFGKKVEVCDTADT